jgi:hypothetical protein
MKEARLKSQSALNPAIISFWFTKVSEIGVLLEAQWLDNVALVEVQQAQARPEIRLCTSLNPAKHPVGDFPDLSLSKEVSWEGLNLPKVPRFRISGSDPALLPLS